MSTCDKCSGKGFITRSDAQNYSYVVKCECQAQKELETQLKSSGLNKYQDKYSFDNFNVKEKWQQYAKQVSQRYANDPNGWLLLLGQSGSGKTHLGVATTKEMLYNSAKNGKYTTSKYVVWTDLMNMVQNDYYKLDEKEFNDITNADILYIDDLFKHDKIEHVSRQEFDVAFAIINSRYVNNKHTVISSEWLIADLFKYDVAFARRLKEMSGDNLIQIGKDVNKVYGI